MYATNENNEKYNHFVYIVKNNPQTDGRVFQQNHPSEETLKKLADNLLRKVGEANNDNEFNSPKEIGCDTISIGCTSNAVN